jgi:hypothetical protein
MTRKQELIRLSEIEFREQLLDCFEGEALTNVLQWIEEGASIPMLYTRLINTYYKGYQPLEAELKLKNINRKDFKSVYDMLNYINRMSRIGSLQWQEGKQRQEYKDRLAVQAILKTLPNAIQIAIAEKLNRVRARGIELTYTEMCELLRPFEPAFNNYFTSKKETQQISTTSQDTKQASQVQSKKPGKKQAQKGKAKSTKATSVQESGRDSQNKQQQQPSFRSNRQNQSVNNNRNFQGNNHNNSDYKRDFSRNDNRITGEVSAISMANIVAIIPETEMDIAITPETEMAIVDRIRTIKKQLSNELFATTNLYEWRW